MLYIEFFRNKICLNQILNKPINGLLSFIEFGPIYRSYLENGRWIPMLQGMLAYILNNALYLAHHDAYFHINDDARKCSYLSVTNNFIFSIIHCELICGAQTTFQGYGIE